MEIHYWSMKRPFYYGGNEKWKELNDYFIRHQLNGEWPPFNGFIESHKVTLKKEWFLTDMTIMELLS